MLKNSTPEVFWKTLSQKYVTIFKITPTAGFILINIVSKRSEASWRGFFYREICKKFQLIEDNLEIMDGVGKLSKGILAHEHVLEINLKLIIGNKGAYVPLKYSVEYRMLKLLKLGPGTTTL